MLRRLTSTVLPTTGTTYGSFQLKFRVVSKILLIRIVFMKACFNVLALIIILSIGNSGFGQENMLKGTVIDQQSKQPIAYSTIEIKTQRTGTYTDSTGNFSIKIEDSSDTLEFNSLGYEMRRYPAGDFIDSIIIIELKPHIFELQEVVIVPKKVKSIRLGTIARKPWRFQVANIFGGQYGTYIENEVQKTGHVRAVSFYIAEVGFPDAPFRIRIYAKDQENQCPGKDLLNESVIVSNPNGEGWFTVDISDYGIEFPMEGMYVMMEWVYSGDQYYYTFDHEMKTKEGKSEIRTYHVYGLSLGNVKKQPDEGFWAKGLGDKWNRMNSYYKGYVDVMINADIEFQIE